MAAGLLMAVCAAITVSVSAVGIHVKCEADHECDKYNYCYTSGYCVPCTDCAFYKRKNQTSYPYCAKEPLQCGGCLPGFEEEIFTGGNVRDLCISADSPLDANDSPTSLVHIYIILGIIAGVLLCLLLAVVFFFARRLWLKGCAQHVQECSDQGSENPPVYTEPLLELRDMATTKPADDGASLEIRETSLKICGEKESVQQAVPFTNADSPYNDWEEMGEASGDNPPAIQDEDTLEIVWVPPPGYGQQASANVTDNSNNEAEARANEVPDSSETANPATTHDSGLSSNSSCGNSSGSLPLRPFEGIGSSPASLPVQQPLTTAHARSLSDEDVSSDSLVTKRARRDSHTQSLDEDAVPMNVVVINVQQSTTTVHK
ncbi:uncharacterized protein LOC111872573 isoform X2 [Cryptotermes secundus]|nr:uncharacterized protein LOC111872573 isoform X2 [Cryptotermes secundus]